MRGQGSRRVQVVGWLSRSRWVALGGRRLLVQGDWIRLGERRARQACSMSVWCVSMHGTAEARLCDGGLGVSREAQW
jgi:hypothetical protein